MQLLCIIQAKYHRLVRALSLVFFRVEWVLARFFDTVSKQRMIDFFLILKKNVSLQKEWSSLHKDELLENWERLSNEMPPLNIEPLD